MRAVPTPRPILRIRSPVVGRGELVFELGSPRVTIGRAEDCDVVLLEQAASRVHAEIRATEHGYLLVDAGSHNGVWIGKQRVTQHLLQDGDTFRIGDSTLSLVLHPHAQTTFVAGLERENDAAGVTAPPPAEPPVAAAPVPDLAAPAPPLPPPPAPPPLAPQTQPAIAAPVWAPPAASAPPQAPAQERPPSFDFGSVGAPHSAADSQPYMLGTEGRGHRPPSFVWTPPEPSPKARTFFGDLADVPDDLRPVEDEPPPRAGPWVALFIVLVVLVCGALVYAFGLLDSD